MYKILIIALALATSIHGMEQAQEEKEEDARIQQYNNKKFLDAANIGRTCDTLFWLNCGAHIDAQDEHGRTALMRACDNEDDDFDVPTVRLLLRQGADPNKPDHYHQRALTHVFREEATEHVKQLTTIVHLLLRYDTQPNNGETSPALIKAVYYGCPKATRLLIRAGARIDSRTPQEEYGDDDISDFEKLEDKGLLELAQHRLKHTEKPRLKNRHLHTIKILQQAKKKRHNKVQQALALYLKNQDPAAQIKVDPVYHLIHAYDK